MLRIRQLKPADFEREYEKWSMNYPWDGSYVTENFKEEMSPYVNDMTCYWSGFWSQGDGASFAGIVNLLDVLDLIDTDNGHVLYRELMRASELNRTARVVHRGHYCHEETMGYDHVDSNTFNWIVQHGVFAGLDLRTLHEDGAMESERMLCEMVDAGAADVLAWLKDKARELYNDLKESYEADISKEAFIEWAEANDEEFDYDYDDTEDCDRSDQQQGDEDNVNLLPNEDLAARQEVLSQA
jgi:hypothetical protein